MPGERSGPRVFGGERETLAAFLDYVRESVILKAEGLSEVDVRRPMVPSGTSLLGLVKHLTRVEIYWFHYTFAGLDVQVPTGMLFDADVSSGIIDGYRRAIHHSNAVIADCDDLAECIKRPHTSELFPLRWVLAHMIQETARHAGHADILREQIDGSVGR